MLLLLSVPFCESIVRVHCFKNPFIRQLKINYLATYATILNNNTTKATEQDKKLNENRPKICKNNHSNSAQVKIQAKNENNPFVP